MNCDYGPGILNWADILWYSLVCWELFISKSQQFWEIGEKKARDLIVEL